MTRLEVSDTSDLDVDSCEVAGMQCDVMRGSSSPYKVKIFLIAYAVDAETTLRIISRCKCTEVNAQR